MGLNRITSSVMTILDAPKINTKGRDPLFLSAKYDQQNARKGGRLRNKPIRLVIQKPRDLLGGNRGENLSTQYKGLY